MEVEKSNESSVLDLPMSSHVVIKIQTGSICFTMRSQCVKLHNEALNTFLVHTIHALIYMRTV